MNDRQKFSNKENIYLLYNAKLENIYKFIIQCPILSYLRYIINNIKHDKGDNNKIILFLKNNQRVKKRYKIIVKKKKNNRLLTTNNF